MFTLLVALAIAVNVSAEEKPRGVFEIAKSKPVPNPNDKLWIDIGNGIQYRFVCIDGERVVVFSSDAIFQVMRNVGRVKVGSVDRPLPSYCKTS